MSSGRTQGALFNTAGAARRLIASPLFAFGPAEAGPAVRRGFLVAVPIGVLLVIELGFDAPTKGALGTGALLAGFPGLDAPARPRAGWQAVSAPLIGIAAALGVLSSQATPSAVFAIGLLGALAGYCFAVSLRLAILGLSVTLAMVIGQGLFLPAGDAPEALIYGTAGGLTQAAWSLIVWIFADHMARDQESGWNAREAARELAANFNLESVCARHGIRFGAALAAGVAVYRIFGFHDHGYWVPLTILFVMRPERDETYHRLILRAVGTVLGLILATALAEAIGDYGLAVALVLTVAAAFSFGMLTVQYALFTAAITTYVVLLTATLEEPAFHAAGQRALGTAVGILIAFLAFLVWPNSGEGRGRKTDIELPASPQSVAAR